MDTIRMAFWWVVLIAGLIVVVAFGYLNPQRTTLDFFFWKSREMPMAFFVLLSFLAGVFTTGLFGLIEIARLRGRIRRTRRAQELLEREVHALRNQPLFDEPPAASGSRTDTIDQRLTHDGLPERVIGGTERG
jgi:uncharacterized integral membrane protein